MFSDQYYEQKIIHSQYIQNSHQFYDEFLIQNAGELCDFSPKAHRLAS